MYTESKFILVHFTKLVKCCFVILTLLLCSPAFGQLALPDSVTRRAVIHYERDANRVGFYPETPALIQISGAPKAFYTYYWEFGDGTYSFLENPVHDYGQPGEYEVKLWVTNNYDNGAPPPSRPEKVPVKEIKHSPEASLTPGPGDPGGFHLQKNREPLPNQEMVMIISYKNSKNYPVSGRLYVFYNEGKFKADNFLMQDIRLHHGERVVQEAPPLAMMLGINSQSFCASTEDFVFYPHLPDSSEKKDLPNTLEEAGQKYRNSKIIEFEGMPAGEERNMFFTLKTTPEMLKDTSAIITIRGIYVPDRFEDSHRVSDLEMEIVTSHDPNKMAVSDTRINYRHANSKKLNYKVRFQNNGEGPASTVRLNVDLPDLLDPTTLEVSDMYPKCPICPDSPDVSYSCLDTVFSEGQVSFIFKNIYLPGSRQKNVAQRDSTKGFVKYSIHLADKLRKQNSTSRTAIIFDKNEPILTNRAKTRFAPGLSIGAKVGYNYLPSLDEHAGYTIGATFSPYKSYRGYFQAELMLGIESFSALDTFRIINEESPIGVPELRNVREESSYHYTSLYLVPGSYRYNITSFLGVGGGLQLSTKIGEKKETATTERSFFYFEQGEVLERNPDGDSFRETTSKSSFTDFSAAVFADIVLGSSRIGPCAGVRYLYNFPDPNEQWQFYVLWKF